MSDTSPQGITGAAVKPAQGPPPPPDITHRPINEESNGRGGTEKRILWMHKALPYIEATCAIALVIITWTYTHYAGGQLDQMKEVTRQGLDAINLGRGQLAVANRNVSASERSFEATVAQFRLDQRAFLVANPTMPLIKEGEALVQTLEVKNTGKTWASRAILTVSVSFSSKETLTFQDLKKTARPTKPVSVALLAPGVVYQDHLEIPTELMPQIINRLSNGGSVYIWGRITYYDIFNKFHTTDYCVYRREPTKEPSLVQCPFGTGGN